MSFREIDPAVIAQQQQQIPLQLQDPELAAALEASKSEYFIPKSCLPSVPSFADETGQRPVIPITDEMISEMTAMFPTVEIDVIRAILEDKAGDKHEAATALLQLSD